MSSQVREARLAAFRRGFVCVFALGFSCPAFSQVEISSTSFETRAPVQPMAEEASFEHSDHWQLDEQEWERVTRLKENLRRFVSVDQISPLEILGIHARTAAERRDYAERWAKIVYDDTTKVLAFQLAFDAAIQELSEGQPLVDITRLPSRHSLIPPLLASDRIALFVERSCRACEELLSRALATLHRTAGLDIYAMDLQTGEEPALSLWARSNGIPPNLVSTRRLTLNFDDGLLARVHPRAEQAPVLMRRRGDRLEQLPITALD